MKRPSPRTLVIAAGCTVAFVFMASIFVPERTEAVEDDHPADAARPSDAYSAAVLDGAVPLGEIEGKGYTVKFFATPTGPLYSVYDVSGRQVAELITLAQLMERFPELAADDAYAEVPLQMMGTDIGGRRP